MYYVLVILEQIKNYYILIEYTKGQLLSKLVSWNLPKNNVLIETVLSEDPLHTLHFRYRTRAIISRGLYFIDPNFEVHLCTVTFGLMYGLYSRAASNQERPMMARVR